jgi:hypothetical protein
MTHYSIIKLGKLNMTSAVADMIVKYAIGLDGTVSDVST